MAGDNIVRLAVVQAAMMIPKSQKILMCVRGISVISLFLGGRRKSSELDTTNIGGKARGSVDRYTQVCPIFGWFCPRGGMVDTRDLKSLVRQDVPVRVRPGAPPPNLA